MLLDITAALRAPGEEIPFLHRDEIPPQDIFGDAVTFSQVLLTGHFSVTDERLRIRGRLTAVAHGRCAGCLKAVDYQVDVPFDESFVRLGCYPEGEEIPGEEAEWAYEGAKVELSHLAMTLAVLDLPIRFECGDDCPGLAGLPSEETQDTHACQKDMPDQHPFSALQQLLTKDQEV
ncbi:MAG: DUF177 domain-containing protein [Clostridia bacterium]|nr:DUF177 domain-containing protein [Clostridia bacterium]